MAIKHHYLKIETKHYQAIEKGLKRFEIRINDRGYEDGDMVYFYEVVDGKETGRKISIPFTINYIIYGGNYGLDEKYCVFGFV